MLTAWLREFLHPDVIPMVLSYEATIQFELQRSYGDAPGAGDGDMNRPSGLLLYGDELFVVDSQNHRIQVFHQGTGRFLRKWGVNGRNEGEFRYPWAVTMGFRNHQALDGREPEIFIPDDHHIQVFRLSDSRFLRRFSCSGFWCGGIVTHGDHIFISRSTTNLIDVLTKWDGRQVRIIGADLNLGPLPGKLLLDDDRDAKELLIPDRDNDRIVALDLVSGQLLRVYELGQNDGPQAVVVHGEEVIVCCRKSNRLVVLDHTTARRLRVVGGDAAGKAEATQFRSACALAISSLNELFVCDCSNNRVLIFR